MQSPKNQASLIWNIADILRGGWKQHEYQNVILPLVVLKRIDSVLSPTKQAVIQTNNQMQHTVSENSMAKFLEAASGHQFYNISSYDFQKLLEDSDNVYVNFRNYLEGFSPNIQDIIEKFGFEEQLKRLKTGKVLHLVLKELDKVDLTPENVTNHDMGYIFEELIRKFNEQSNETAGEHYTPREVIRLMTRILFDPDQAHITGEEKIIEVYDPCCGTGGMLTIGKEFILEHINPKARVFLYGQELNSQTYAIAKGDMLIKGEDANLIKGGSGENDKDSTLSNDQFYDKQFDYVIANPPYGVDWKKDQDAVLAEAARGIAGRFPAGVPSVSDAQLLFLQHMVSKMRPLNEGGGRVAVVHNGSPLQSGAAGSGPSEIRRYLIENDLLESIIALPTNMFYNTPIATFIWVLTNRKSEERKGKIQLIDASLIFHKLRKNLGDKSKELTVDDIKTIYGQYKEFTSTEVSKLISNEEFGYTQVVVEQPLYDSNGNAIIDRNGTPKPNVKKRDTEKIPLNQKVETFFRNEVEPFVPNAWLDRKKDKLGYEIPFNSYFYKLISPRPVAEIDAELESSTQTIRDLLKRPVSERVAVTGLNPNVAFKTVDIPWLAKIPEHWEIKRAKYIFQKVNIPPFADDDIVTAFRDGEVILRKLRREEGFTFADKEIGYQHVDIGDLVIHAMDAFAGAVGVSKSKGKMSPVCNICKPISDNIDTAYFAELIRSMTSTNYLVAIAKGIRERSTDFRFTDFSNMFFPVPPLSEQIAIREYIAQQNKMDNLLKNAVQKQMSLLKERKQSVISDTVRGKVSASEYQ